MATTRLRARTAFGFFVSAALGLGVLGLDGCARPPADAYTGDTGGQDAVPALDIGANTAHEACTLQPDQNGGRIYCGDYVQAAGRVLKDAHAADLTAFVTSSPWRTAYDRRFQCGAPSPTTILDQPAIAMACTRRQGGWPQVVVAANIDGTLYVADAVKPVEPVMARAIGVLAGRLPSVAATATPQSSGLATQRAAAAAVNAQGAGAIAEVDRLMARGAKENQAGNYVAAEAAYRAATTLQQRVVGQGNPALAVPLARLALQISNQGRYSLTSLISRGWISSTATIRPRRWRCWTRPRRGSRRMSRPTRWRHAPPPGAAASTAWPTTPRTPHCCRIRPVPPR
jgi:hypothetical protein